MKTAAINVASNVAFYRGKVRVFQTALKNYPHLTDPARHAVMVQLDIPLAQLPPGYYTVQVDAMDANAQRYAFPRIFILVGSEKATGN